MFYSHLKKLKDGISTIEECEKIVLQFRTNILHFYITPCSKSWFSVYKSYKLFLCLDSAYLLYITTDGYHAKTPLRCGITFCSTYTLVLVFLRFLPTQAQLPVILINRLVTLILVFLFSPVPAVNKPLTAVEATRNRKRSLVIASIPFLVVLIAVGLRFLRNFSLYMSCGQTTSAVFLCLSKTTE